MEEWIVADSAWWGRWLGPCALRVRGGLPYGGPVPMTDMPGGAHLRPVSGTLLPGLRDAHVHSALVDLRRVRAGGIAAVDDLGGVPAQLAALRQTSEGNPALPRIAFAGAFLTAPGGYPSDRSWAPRGSWREVRSPGDAAAAVAEQRAAGAAMIKIVHNADAGPTLDSATFAAVVAAAHAAGMPVVVHAEGPGSVEAAVEAGADRLAHVPWTERLDDGVVRAVGHMTWISTLDIHGHGTPTPSLNVALHNLRGFLAAGGRVAYGTDLGNGPLLLGVNAREVRALQAAGLSVDDVLIAMTDPTGLAVMSCHVPGGLDRDATAFATSLSTARVLDAVPPGTQ